MGCCAKETGRRVTAGWWPYRCGAGPSHALRKSSAVPAILAGAALDTIALALFVCHCSPLSFLAFAALPAVQVATHGDDARHKRSYVSIEIDNERVRLLFHRAESL